MIVWFDYLVWLINLFFQKLSKRNPSLVHGRRVGDEGCKKFYFCVVCVFRG